MAPPLLPPGAVYRPLPKRRTGFTYEGTVGGHKLFFRTSNYPDGTLGELAIDIHKEGATMRSVLSMFAQSVSMGLQYGVPLEAYVNLCVYTRFEPNGDVEGSEVMREATSILDYIFRTLGVEYLGREDLRKIPKGSALELSTEEV